MDENEHDCQLQHDSRSHLPKLLPMSSRWSKIGRAIRKTLILSPTHPLTKLYFKSQLSISKERKRQVDFDTIYIIHPLSSFFQYWSLFLLVINLIYSWVMPFYIAFYEQMEHTTTRAIHCIHIIISAILLTEVAIVFFVGYYEKTEKEFIFEKKKIAKNYMFGTFIPDVLGAFPFAFLFEEYCQCNIAVEHMEFLFFAFCCYLFNLFRFKTLDSYYQIIPNLFDWTYATSLSLKIVFFGLYVAHWATCFKFIIPIFANYFKSLWDSNTLDFEDAINDLELVGEYSNKTIEFKYIKNFLSTLKLLLASGNTTDNNETIYHQGISVVIMIVGWVYSSYVLVVCVQCLLTAEASERKHAKMMKQVEEYMEEKKLPEKLQSNIRKYLQYKFQGKYFDEEEIQSTVSERMRSNILMHQCHELVGQVDVFQTLPEHIIENIVRALELEIYIPGDMIIEANTVGDSMYFISSGSVEILSPTGNQLAILEDGQSFGEMSLVSKGIRSASVFAKEMCEVYRLLYDDFYVIIEEYPDLLHDIQVIAFNRLNLNSAK